MLLEASILEFSDTNPEDSDISYVTTYYMFLHIICILAFLYFQTSHQKVDAHDLLIKLGLTIIQRNTRLSVFHFCLDRFRK